MANLRRPWSSDWSFRALMNEWCTKWKEKREKLILNITSDMKLILSVLGRNVKSIFLVQAETRYLCPSGTNTCTSKSHVASITWLWDVWWSTLKVKRGKTYSLTYFTRQRCLVGCTLKSPRVGLSFGHVNASSENNVSNVYNKFKKNRLSFFSKPLKPAVVKTVCYVSLEHIDQFYCKNSKFT